jgi:hypothetical protein
MALLLPAQRSNDASEAPFERGGRLRVSPLTEENQRFEDGPGVLQGLPRGRRFDGSRPMNQADRHPQGERGEK